MKITSTSIKMTQKIGEKIAKKLNGGEIIALNGEIGAGKTVLVKGIARGLKIKDDILSPTFSILNAYKGKYNLYHYDVYRLNDLTDLLSMGLDEYFYSDNNICIIEWAQKMDLKQIKNVINISIKYINQDTREIEIDEILSLKHS